MDNNPNLLDDLSLDNLPAYESAKKKKKPVKLFVILGICVAVAAGGGIAAWRLLTPAQAAEEKTYKTYTVSQGDIRISYEADGVVSIPFSYADAQVSAEITKLYVSKGDSFKEGDLLAEFDDSALVTAVDNARDSVQNASDSLNDAINSVGDAESNYKSALSSVTDAQDNVKDAESAVQDALDSVEEAKKNVTSSQRNLEKQETAYVSAVNSLEESEIKKENNILSQKQTISDLKEQIKTLKTELALMEEFPDDYSANEVTSKKNTLAAQEIKLKTETDNLALLERETTDTTLSNASAAVDDAKEALEKAKANVTKAETNVEKARSNVTKAEKGVQTARDNAEKAFNNIGKAKTNVEKAERALEKAEKALEDAIADLSKSKLYAPCNGEVIAVNKSVGEISAAIAYGSGSTTNSLIVYKTENALYTAAASIPELDIGEVFVGQAAEILIDAVGSGLFTGTLTDLSSFANSGSNNVVSYQSKVSFDPKGEEIRDQMNCSITYVTKEVKDVLNIPNDAIYTKNGKSYVNVRNSDGVDEERVVTTGFSDGSVCEIKSGLSRGETVVSQTATTSTGGGSSTSNTNNAMQGGITIMPGGGGGGSMAFRIAG